MNENSCERAPRRPGCHSIPWTPLGDCRTGIIRGTGDCTPVTAPSSRCPAFTVHRSRRSSVTRSALDSRNSTGILSVGLFSPGQGGVCRTASVRAHHYLTCIVLSPCKGRKDVQVSFTRYLSPAHSGCVRVKRTSEPPPASPENPYHHAGRDQRDDQRGQKASRPPFLSRPQHAVLVARRGRRTDPAPSRPGLAPFVRMSCHDGCSFLSLKMAEGPGRTTRGCALPSAPFSASKPLPGDPGLHCRARRAPGPSMKSDDADGRSAIQVVSYNPTAFGLPLGRRVADRRPDRHLCGGAMRSAGAPAMAGFTTRSLPSAPKMMDGLDAPVREPAQGFSGSYRSSRENRTRGFHPLPGLSPS